MGDHTGPSRLGSKGPRQHPIKAEDQRIQPNPHRTASYFLLHQSEISAPKRLNMSQPKLVQFESLEEDFVDQTTVWPVW